MRGAQVHVRRWRLKRKLNDEQVARVRKLPWEPCNALARELGISPALISGIRNGHIYKRPLPQQTYWARVTDGRERYSLGPFLTPEAAQNAIDKFQRTNRWPRGQISRANKGKGYRARIEIGTFETRWSAERGIKAALAKLSAHRINDLEIDDAT